MTPLALAVVSQNSKFVKALIDRGADPDFKIDGRRYGVGGATLICVAAGQGDSGSVEALVNAGAKVSVVDSDGQTPLHLVVNGFGDQDKEVMKRFTHTVRTLLAAQADPNVKNKQGKTPLALAASRDFFGAVELLVDKTESLDVELADGSLLHWAAKNGLSKTSLRLLTQPATQSNRSPGASDKLNVDLTNSNGRTPLQVAAENGKPDIVKMLISFQANLDHVDNDGSTALLIAATGGHAEVVAALLKAGADTTKLDLSGHSALHLAAWAGDAKVIMELLSKMKVAQSITKSGYTPLHAAAWNGHESAVNALLHGGADPNAADSDGWTPLHKAAYRGHVKAVKALIENGADRSLQNDVEMTALQLAQSNSEAKEIASLLE